MTMLTLGEAARLTGLGKTTIQRSIKAGRISASRTEFGSYAIDPAELHRVYPITPATVAETDDVERDATADALVSELRNVIADLRQDRDRWQEAHTQAQAALTQAVTATQRLLPSPVEHDATPAAPPQRRWWRRAG